MSIDDLPTFTLELEDNVDGWGPVSLPKELEDLPYAPFQKDNKLGRVADFTGQQTQRGRMLESNRERSYMTGVQNVVFTFQPEEDDTTFHLVDSKAKTRQTSAYRVQSTQRNTRGRGAAQQRNYQRLDRSSRGTGRGVYRGGASAGRGRGGKQYKSWRDADKPQKLRESSVEVKRDWSMCEEIEFSRLSKLNFEPPEPEDIKTCGMIEGYDKAYDRVTPKAGKLLQQINRTFHNVSTSEDPEIIKAAEQGVANIFAVDSILALLMTCNRTVLPWDIIIRRQGNNLFFDKRERSSIDFCTVSETALDFVLDDKDLINAPDALALEATYINHNFSQQVLKRDSNERYEFEHPNPFAEPGDDVASVGYRYRQWALGEGMTLMCRCEIDGVLAAGNTEQFLSVKALNEYDSKITGVDWRQKLELQPGAVLATEIKNNNSKLARWAVQAILAGVDYLKLGFVSRVSQRDNTKHVILGSRSFKPQDFAAQINLNMGNSWGVIKALSDICLKLPEGKYLLLKDPNKPIMRLFQIPPNAFDADDVVHEDETVSASQKREPIIDDDDDFYA